MADTDARQDRAVFLVREILGKNDMLVPVLLSHLTELRMDTDGEQATVDTLRDMVAALNGQVLELRALSNTPPHDQIQTGDTP
jgi:uncharacterized coiled-coil protein SlyX